MTNNDFRDPAHLLARCPAHLGYIPANGLVIFLLRRTAADELEVVFAFFADITLTTEQATHFLATLNLRAYRGDAAILIAICDQRHDVHARHLLDATRDGLRDVEIPVIRRLSARDVTEAGGWVDVDSGECGPSYPYTDSIYVARAIHDGAQIHHSRGAAEAEFTHLPPAPPVHIGDHGQLVLRTTEEIAWLLATATPPPLTDPTLPTRAGIIISSHTALRDLMIGLAADNAHAAANLWTHIGRRLRGQPRAEALGLAAACLCLAGDISLARFAIEAAMKEGFETHSLIPDLVVMIEAMVTVGLDPDEIRAALLALSPPPSGADPA